MASTFFRTWWDPNETDEELEEAGDRRGADDDLDDGVQRINGLPTPFGRPTPWGGRTEQLPPERLAEIERNANDAERWFRVPKASIRVDDSDHVRLGGRDWVGLFTPGHTNDHLCLFDQEDGVLLSGDHVLPTITPHISGLIDGDPLRALRRLARPRGGPPRACTSCCRPTATRSPICPAGRRDQGAPRGGSKSSRELSDAAGWATVQQLSQQLFAERNWGRWPRARPTPTSSTCAWLGEAERREQAGLLEYLVP